MSVDVLSTLRARLDALVDERVGSHSQVLEDVHRGLVAELEALSTAGAPANTPHSGGVSGGAASQA